MGFAPAPPGPPPAAPGASITVGMSTPTLPAIAICGLLFKFPPAIFFSFGFTLPTIPFPPKIPLPYISLSLNCNLSNPLNVSAGLSYGGGRQSNADPDPDMQEAA